MIKDAAICANATLIYYQMLCKYLSISPMLLTFVKSTFDRLVMPYFPYAILFPVIARQHCWAYLLGKPADAAGAYAADPDPVPGQERFFGEQGLRHWLAGVDGEMLAVDYGQPVAFTLALPAGQLDDLAAYCSASGLQLVPA